MKPGFLLQGENINVESKVKEVITPPPPLCILFENVLANTISVLWSYATPSVSESTETPPPAIQAARGSVIFRLRWVCFQVKSGSSSEPVFNSFQCMDTFSHIVNDLLPGKTYTFSLEASYITDSLQQDLSKVDSAWITRCSATCTTEIDAPKCPCNLSVSTVTHNSLKIKWERPGYDGGSKITQYVLQMAPHLNSSNLSDCPPESYSDLWSNVYEDVLLNYKVPKLDSNTAYWFRVRAINAVGVSDWSTAVKFKTSIAAPGPPPPPFLLETECQQLTLGLGLSSQDSEQLVEFRIEMSSTALNNVFDVVYNGRDRRVCIANLNVATAYTFRVCAKNLVGVSPYSTLVSFSTAADRPSKSSPPRVEKARIPNSISNSLSQGPLWSSVALVVRWSEPSQTNGSSILRYRLQMSREANPSESSFVDAFIGNSLGAEITALLPGHPYFFRISASNVIGESAFSDSTLGSTAPAPPDPTTPPILISKTKASLCLQWTPGASNGQPITNYTLRCSPLNSPNIPSVETSVSTNILSNPNFEPTQATITNLSPGISYACCIVATNAMGDSYPSPASVISTAKGEPGVPQGLTTVSPPASDSISIRWMEANGNGFSITAYHVEMRLSESVKLPNALGSKGFVDVYTGTSNTCSIKKGLIAGTPYFLRVRAENEEGYGPYSDVIEVMTAPSIPYAPINLQAVNVDEEVRQNDVNSSLIASSLITWTSPNDCGSPILHYVVEFGLEVNATSLFEKSAIVNVNSGCRIILTDLSRGTRYRVRVRAVNAVGDGSVSAPLSFRTITSFPGKVSSLLLRSVTASSLKFAWSAPEFDGGSSLVDYEVRVCRTDGVPMSGGLGFKPIYVPALLPTLELPKLCASTKYEVTVAARNSEGRGAESYPVIFETLEYVPIPVSASSKLNNDETSNIDIKKKKKKKKKEWKTKDVDISALQKELEQKKKRLESRSSSSDSENENTYIENGQHTQRNVYFWNTIKKFFSSTGGRLLCLALVFLAISIFLSN